MYHASIMYGMTNMVICKIGKTKGGTDGDVIIIPATQTSPDAANVNNPLPTFASAATDTANSFTAVKAAYIDTGDSNKKYNMAVIAGSDEYIGTMTYIFNPADEDTFTQI